MASVEKLFQEFVAYAKENLAIEGVAVADESKVLLEHHFSPDITRNIYSHTKSYMATAAGIAISEGNLCLEDKLADFFPEYIPENPDERLLKINLKHLLTMSSGFGGAFLMGDDRRAGVGYPDYMAYMMNLPVVKEPGTEFDYSTADSILAGRMIEKATGRRLDAYLYDYVFSKLGQGWPQWENDPQGHPIGGGGMDMKLTDMLKLGQVYLAGGKWKGKQIVDPAWVRESTRKQIDTKNTNQDVWNCGYGYQFWMSPYAEAYRADGAYGQISTVLPKSGLVVAVQCPEVGDFEKVKLALHEMIHTQV